MEPHDVHTTAVHAGREELHALGVHALPLDMSTTYPLPSLDGAAAQIDAFANGDQPTGSPIYARLHNPTVARFEQALATLEHAPESVAFASGMAALTAVLLALPHDRRHVVAVRPLYGGSDHLLASELLGVTTTFVDASDVATALTDRTGLVILETPQNPTTTLVDIAAVCAAAGDVPVLVDNTFATSVLQQPLLHGASLSLHSATKFIGGHGDAMGGVVACGKDWARSLRQVRIATGAVLHPYGAHQLHRGIATLAVRVRQAQATATELAARLQAHPAVTRVHHPSLASGSDANIVDRQMSGPGAMLAFEIAGGFEAARAMLNSVSLVTHAVSLGSTDTLIQHPASLTHRIVAESDRTSNGINDSLLRISAGLENVDDLWRDLANALDRTLTSRLSKETLAPQRQDAVVDDGVGVTHSSVPMSGMHT